MKLKTTLLGKTYQFASLKEVLAKANEEKTGDRLAGLAAETDRNGLQQRWCCPLFYCRICGKILLFPMSRMKSPASFRTM